MKITPRVDIAFKKIFGVEENKDLLISLINSVISKEDEVVDLELLNPYNPQNFRHDKLSILDIKARGIDGKLFNIEIQITDEADYHDRALYYWAKLYNEQLAPGENYGLLKKAIGIHILNFVSITDKKDYHNKFIISENESGDRYFHDFEIHTIELKKFLPDSGKADLQELINRAKNALDVWAAFLTRHDLLPKHDLPEEFKKVPVEKAIKVVDVMNFSDEERDLYEDHLKWLRIEANTLEKRFRQGIEKGREEGKEEGKEEKKIEIAQNLLNMNLDTNQIVEATGLSREKILELQKDIAK